MRCIEHLLQRQWMLLSFRPHYRLSTRSISAGLTILFLIIAPDRSRSISEHFTSVVGADQDDAEMLAAELRKFSCGNVLYLARCRSCR